MFSWQDLRGIYVPRILGGCGNTGKVSSPSLSLQLKVGPTGQCNINTGKVGHLNRCIDMSMIPRVLKDKCALMVTVQWLNYIKVREGEQHFPHIYFSAVLF